MEDIESFMKELGSSFCFIGSEYKIKICDSNEYVIEYCSDDKIIAREYELG